MDSSSPTPLVQGPSIPVPATRPPTSNGPPHPLLPPPSSGSGGDKDDEGRTMGSNEGITGAATDFTGGTGMSRPRSKTREGDTVNLRRVFAKLLKKLMSRKYAKRAHYYPFATMEVICILKAVKKVLEAEPPLVEIKVPAVVIGDLHGQFVDLARIFEFYNEGEIPGYMNNRYVFLGDYVDRGRQSLEIVLVLFMLKYLYPTQFALLRGNHECRAINKAYGFYAEIKERFLDPRKASELFEMFNDLFTHLPLACIVAGTIMCMHGGISSKMKSRDDILKVPKPLKDVATNQIATDLLWADPMIGLPGEIPNKVRGVSVYFGEATLDQFLKDLNVKMVIRGHQMMMNGFNFFHQNLVTVFSAAAYYPDKPNRGAVATIDKMGRVAFRIVAAGEHDPEMKPKLFRGDHDVANEHDTGYVKSVTKPETPGANRN